ncbi:hypothetical protein SteCoe_37287 [Stentor coeruleus]|uniref:Hexose transporter 1 n=1 Tax=Stentor coeruleus TaxID=5963 RepID=A0A1R2ANC7_9CILI|nr:hypothetical protein SteCoe_37287 [Stentor coeruleus]
MPAYIKKSNVWALAMHIAIANFNFCYSLGVFNTCSDNVSFTLNWGSMKNTYIAIFSTMIPAGAFLSSLFAGYLLSKYGRRGSMIIADFVFILGCLFSSLPYTFAFGLGRFLCGLGSGLFLTISPIYLNEITPDSMVSQTGPLIQIFNSAALIVAFGLGLMLPTENFNKSKLNGLWSFMFIFPGALALYQLVYFIFIMKFDSPKWYLDNGLRNKAYEALSYSYMPESINVGMMRFSIVRNEADASEERLIISFKDIFTDKKYRKMLRIGIMLAIIQQLSGINAAIFYSTEIFNRIGGNIAMARIYTFIMGIANMAAGMCTMPLLRKFGRKTLMISGQYALMFVCTLLGIFSEPVSVNSAFSLICVYLYIVFFTYSMAGTLWTYLGELCIDKALAVATTVNLLFTCIITIAFPFAAIELGISVVFFFFAGMLLISIFYCHWDLIETKDKTKPEIMRLIFR